MMDYQKVFDIIEAGYKSWSFPAFGLIFVAVGAVLLLLRRHFPGWWGEDSRRITGFAVLVLGFSILWTVTSFISTYGEYRTLRQAIEQGQVSVVEGTVNQFKPMPASGHAMESFCVRDNCFEYSDFVITGGFNNTSSHGGPIQEGLPVRVTFLENKILKLEIRETANQAL